MGGRRGLVASRRGSASENRHESGGPARGSAVPSVHAERSEKSVGGLRGAWYHPALPADVAELADAQDSGSCGDNTPWRFDSSHPHEPESRPGPRPGLAVFVATGSGARAVGSGRSAGEDDVEEGRCPTLAPAGDLHGLARVRVRPPRLTNSSLGSLWARSATAGCSTGRRGADGLCSRRVAA